MHRSDHCHRFQTATYRGCPDKLVKASADQVDIIIEDTGPGISDTEKKRVIEKFVRLESSRQAPENGLGLSLVEAVASLHKAELTMEDNNPRLHVTQKFTSSLNICSQATNTYN